MKKEVLTRKKRAFRRLLVLAAAAVLLGGLTGYCFLPIQALWRAADQLDMEQVRVIKRFYAPKDLRSFLSVNYLAESEDAMLLCSVQGSVGGWGSGKKSRVEIWEDSPAHAGLWRDSGDEGDTYWLFGRMKEKPTAMNLYYREQVDLVTHRISIEVPVEHLFQGEDGTWYLLSQVDRIWMEQESVEGYFGGPRRFGLFLSRNGEELADIAVQ